MRRTLLDTATVVGEAVRIADGQGLDELTMRQLAARLGVQAMALYRYVANRDALLDAMVAALLDQLAATMTSRTSSRTTDSRYLTETAHDVRNLALAHPWLIRLMVLRPPPAIWLSRPMSSLACTDAFLDALRRRGLGPAASVSTYRTFNAFLLAYLLLDSSAAAQDPAGPGHLRHRGSPSPTPRRRYPVLVDHLELLDPDDRLTEFRRELHLFIQSALGDRTPTATSSTFSSGS